MNMTQIPFGTTDWASVAPVEYQDEKGAAYWRTRQFGDVRVRIVEYTAGYRADQVADNADAHRSFSPVGAKLFVVD